MSDILVLDLGSSALKAIRVAPDGGICASHSHAVETRGSGGRREQDADGWCRIAGAAIAAAAQEGAIDAIALSGTMQNLVPMTRAGHGAGPAILYSDNRIDAAARADMEARLPGDFARRIGNRPDNAQPVFKLMAGAAAGADHLHFGAKDVLAEWLCGARAVDATTATTTGLMDIRARDWDGEILAAAGIARECLPVITPGDAILGETRGGGGVPAGLPVVCGAGDAGASAWGAGAEDAGAAHVYLGSSGWVARTLPEMPADLPHANYTLAMPTGGAALSIAPILTAGAALDWVARCTGREIGAALATLGPDPAVAPGAPLFLPYLSGERSPFEDGAVRGGFVNLDAGHDREALLLAAIEGLGHALRHCLEGMADAPDRVTAIGGTLREAAVAAPLADALGVPLAPAAQPLEATALGAARLAARALGRPVPPASAAGALRRPRGGAEAARRYRAYREASRLLRNLAGAMNG